jgi:hypothetical protein
MICRITDIQMGYPYYRHTNWISILPTYKLDIHITDIQIGYPYYRHTNWISLLPTYKLDIHVTDIQIGYPYYRHTNRISTFVHVFYNSIFPHCPYSPYVPTVSLHLKWMMTHANMCICVYATNGHCVFMPHMGIWNNTLAVHIRNKLVIRS